ncbi:MAG: CBS domain-containing protein [Myxococcota bacterium]|nr:CBS domain-containing protein [Myxococcota bacterium]
MARYVDEIMNPELFVLRPQDTVGTAMLGILSLGVTAAPVVDVERRPLGVVSLRDLVSATGGPTVGDRMSRPAITIQRGAEIRDAGREIAEYDVHRLIAVDEAGRAVGVVSSLDVVRALLELPVTHPAAFPHQDAAGVSWSDPFVLDADHVPIAPEGPGLLVLMHDELHRPVMPLWAEASEDVRARLGELVEAPHLQDVWLRRILEHDVPHLRVRVASVLDPGLRGASLDHARTQIAASRRPG